MTFYNTDCISKEDLLQNNRQFKLTIRTSYKLLETGTQESEDGEEYFIVRLTKNAVDGDGEPNISYIDMYKEDFDAIVMKSEDIINFLQHNIVDGSPVYKTGDIYLWVRQAHKPLVCIRGIDGTTINMIKRTFERLINRANWVQFEYDRLLGDLEDESQDTENFDNSYDDYSDDSEYTSDDD